MPHRTRRQTDYQDAAQILRGYKERIEQLEERGRGGDQTVQLFRPVTDVCACADSVTVTEGTAQGFRFGTSQWGYDEFGSQ